VGVGVGVNVLFPPPHAAAYNPSARLLATKTRFIARFFIAHPPVR
jgi:hypothetical protein